MKIKCVEEQSSHLKLHIILFGRSRGQQSCPIGQVAWKSRPELPDDIYRLVPRKWNLMVRELAGQLSTVDLETTCPCPTGPSKTVTSRKKYFGNVTPKHGRSTTMVIVGVCRVVWSICFPQTAWFDLSTQMGCVRVVFPQKTQNPPQASDGQIKIAFNLPLSIRPAGFDDFRGCSGGTKRNFRLSWLDGSSRWLRAELDSTFLTDLQKVSCQN